jgi:NADH-quinone oxidoreductase subunit N
VNPPLTPELTTTLTQVFAQVQPEIVLLIGACFLFLMATVGQPSRQRSAIIGLLTVIVAGVFVFFRPAPVVPPGYEAVAPLALDRLSHFVSLFALVTGAGLVLLTWHAIPDRNASEYHACLHLAVAGTMLVGAANDLVILFLALELLSIPTYVMLYLPRADARAQEATIKYFLLSILSSAVMLFGFSYLYGLTGSTNLSALADALADPSGAPLPVVALVAIVMVVAGLGFKITAVPFHFYAPDVYQGGPTAAVALLATLPKIAGFVALTRILGFVATVPAAAAFDPQLTLLLWILAAITMTVGNVLALLQDNLKRILAYSGIAHAGYMLIGLAATAKLVGSGDTADVTGIESVLFYLIAYTAMTLGAFGVIAVLDRPGRPVETVDDLAGVGLSHPFVGATMTLFLLSLIGIPLTAGFVGKLMLFRSAIEVRDASGGLFLILVLIGAINAAIGAAYYLRLMGVLYLRTGLTPPSPVQSLPGLTLLGLCAAATLALGVYPRPVQQTSRDAVMAGGPVAVDDLDRR